MFKATKYTKMVIDGEQIKKDTRNTYRVISIRQYLGKPASNLAAGINATLQVIIDDTQPLGKDGKPIENNLYETFDVTIPGAAYPSDIMKGDIVSLGNFMSEVSYYIDYKLILRFDSIKKLPPKTGGTNVAS